MDAQSYIIEKYGIDTNVRMPIYIPNMGRADIPIWLRELDFKKGVEVGTASGDYAHELCSANPQMHLWGIDPYLPYSTYRGYDNPKVLEKFELRAIEKLTSLPNFEFIKKWSMDAVKDFEDNSIDFVYIDANHEDPFVTEDITEWSKKVRSGGIVSGHDFEFVRGANIAVKQAVKRHVIDKKIKPWFVLGARDKRAYKIRDPRRSWVYVKP